MAVATTPVRAGDPVPESPVVPTDIDRWIDEILNRWPAVGLALGVVRDGEVAELQCRGLADIESGTPITDRTVFRVASISKTFTAVAVMQLVESGLVDLDRPATDYLRSYRLALADEGDPVPTVRQLLTHTAGMPESARPWHAFRPDFGESFPLSTPMPTLAEFYRGTLRLEAPPGSRFVYGNQSFATLGQIVEDVSGEPLHQYLRRMVFDPIGMTDSDLVRSEAVSGHLATGYRLGSRGPVAVEHREMVTAGAASVYSTPRDMGRYLGALLGGGANRHGRMLRPETLETMYEPQYRPDSRLPGIGIAFTRIDLGGHPAVEHGGVLPGFNSQIFVAPEDGVAVMAFTNGSPNAMFWMPAELAGLLGGLIAAPEAGIRRDVPQHPELWTGICGRYKASVGLGDARARMMLGSGAEVFVRGRKLVLRVLSPVPALYRGFELHPDDPDDPYSFRIDASGYGVGALRVVFAVSPGLPPNLYLEVMPLTLTRVSPRAGSAVWAAAAIGALGIGLGGLRLAKRGSGGGPGSA